MTEQELCAKAMFVFAEYGVLDKIVLLHPSMDHAMHWIAFGLTTHDVNDNSPRWSVVFSRTTGEVTVVDRWTSKKGWVDIYL